MFTHIYVIFIMYNNGTEVQKQTADALCGVFSGNLFGAAGTQALAAGLEVNRTLRTLVLTSVSAWCFACWPVLPPKKKN